jgi:Tfp pilus assembly protein PilN
MRAVNLLPESSRAHRPSGRLSGSAYGVIGCLAVVLLMAVAYVLTTNQINDRQTKIAVAEQETQEARQQVASLAAFGDFAAVKEARLIAVRDRAAVRFDWERLMREVAHVIPGDVWLQEMTASVAPQDASGGATPAPDGAAATGLNPSLKVTGCAKGQEAVARMMVRLRKLHRAQDVELVESAIEDPAAGATVVGDSAAGPTSEGCPARYRFDIDVTFSPPTPEQTGVRVPVALGGGS